jgi:hypothetical protein
MNTIKSFLNAFVILATLSFLAAGCDKTPKSSVTNSSQPPAAAQQPPIAAQQPPSPIQAEPFHGQVYKSLNGRTVLTLVSRDECEIAEGGTTLLCKYTKQDDKLRIVTTALGTSQVLYFRFTDQGLDDNKGNVLLSPDKYAAALEVVRQQQEAALAKQREEEAKRQAEQHKQEVIAKSEAATPTIATIAFADSYVIRQDEIDFHKANPNFRKWGNIQVSETQLIYTTMRSDGVGGTASPGLLRYLHQISEVESDNHFVLTNQYPSGISQAELLRFKSQSEALAAHDTIASALEAWKKKFPEAVLP